MTIAVLAGLGNPGAAYAHSRHNLGFWLVDAFAAACGAKWRGEPRCEAEAARADWAGRPLWLLKPLTFMNDSGRAVAAFLRFHKLPPAALAVVHDDITLPLGRLKVSVGGSAGGHNGIASLLAHAGEGFARVKLGIGGKGHPAMDLADHVLGRLTPGEEAALAAQLPDYLAGLRLLLERGPAAAMNLTNRRPPSLSPPPAHPAP